MSSRYKNALKDIFDEIDIDNLKYKHYVVIKSDEVCELCQKAEGYATGIKHLGEIKHLFIVHDLCDRIRDTKLYKTLENKED